MDKLSKRNRVKSQGLKEAAVSEINLFPEDIVMATLHVVGSNIRLVDDERLANAFDEMAKECSIF